MSTWDDWLAAAAERREELGLTRRLVAHGSHEQVIDLAGNDYLGLSQHHVVKTEAAKAALEYGAGAGASRLVTGTLTVHEQLEQELATFIAQPSALVMSTGYHANLSVVTALVGKGDLVVSDAHIHASLIDAVRHSRAEIVVNPHNDVDAVEAALAGHPGRRALVLAESIYSVLGDQAPLLELATTCERHDALLVVDEAHGLGVAGRQGEGAVRALGLAGHPNVIVTATLSKALGAQGGAVLASAAVRAHLINSARPFIFDTALAPAPTAGALAALRLLIAEPSRVALIHERIDDLCDRLGVERPAGAVVSVPMPTPQLAIEAQAAVYAQGIRVGCFRPPSVPDGISRLRITINAGVSDADWERAEDVLDKVTTAYGGANR
jgi:8-amino-7-oxononanoate synthase